MRLKEFCLIKTIESLIELEKFDEASEKLHELLQKSVDEPVINYFNNPVAIRQWWKYFVPEGRELAMIKYFLHKGKLHIVREADDDDWRKYLDGYWVYPLKIGQTVQVVIETDSFYNKWHVKNLNFVIGTVVGIGEYGTKFKYKTNEGWEHTTFVADSLLVPLDLIRLESNWSSDMECENE